MTMSRVIVAMMLMFMIGSRPVFAQTTDSLVQPKPDSVRNWYSGHVLSRPKFRPVAFVIPAVLVGYGFLAVHDQGALRQLDLSTRAEIQEDHPRFAAHVDDYLQIVPAAAVFALNLSGVHGKHNLFDASFLYLTATAIMSTSTHFVKNGVGRLRPDESGSNSFPSGHTASAFMAAEFLHQEFKDADPWITLSGYFVATATGTLRLYNNKHWFSDVVAGAGFGIASTKISYLVYPYIKCLFKPAHQKNFVLLPFHQQGASGLLLSGQF